RPHRISAVTIRQHGNHLATSHRWPFATILNGRLRGSLVAVPFLFSASLSTLLGFGRASTLIPLATRPARLLVALRRRAAHLRDPAAHWDSSPLFFSPVLSAALSSPLLSSPLSPRKKKAEMVWAPVNNAAQRESAQLDSQQRVDSTHADR
ncbi:hypothetical protein DQ04_03761050, partial [Trypanosoma grayi]|uniref:hypothetical protein n=1 Tax=Trypanosoma grayi TaxID=71804 RepID=UPI0004F47DA2